MLFSLKLRYARLCVVLSLFCERFIYRRQYVIAGASDFRRTMLRSHNQRRERGNVALRLGRRSGRYNATR